MGELRRVIAANGVHRQVSALQQPYHSWHSIDSIATHVWRAYYGSSTFCGSVADIVTGGGRDLACWEIPMASCRGSVCIKRENEDD
jgi:hypothetical protein